MESTGVKDYDLSLSLSLVDNRNATVFLSQFLSIIAIVSDFVFLQAFLWTCILLFALLGRFYFSFFTLLIGYVHSRRHVEGN